MARRGHHAQPPNEGAHCATALRKQWRASGICGGAPRVARAVELWWHEPGLPCELDVDGRKMAMWWRWLRHHVLAGREQAHPRPAARPYWLLHRLTWDAYTLYNADAFTLYRIREFLHPQSRVGTALPCVFR